MKRGDENLRLVLYHLFQSHGVSQGLPACGILATRGSWVCSQCGCLNLAVDRLRLRGLWGQYLQLALRSKQSPSSGPFLSGTEGFMET